VKTGGEDFIPDTMRVTSRSRCKVAQVRQLQTVNKRHRRASVKRQSQIASFPMTSQMPVAAAARDLPETPARSDWNRGKNAEPVEIVDRADIPGGGELVLLKCGTDFSIEFGSEELMGSCDHLSEQALATLTCQRLATTKGPVLVGGLGMGFTLRAALAVWAPTADVVVAELVPKIVTWAQGPLAHIFGNSLADPRVTLRVADVHDVIVEAQEYYDAILLDVDNGPDGLIQAENERLYCNWGLRACFDALRFGGILAVWSAYSDAAFFERLEDAGFVVEEIRLPAFAGSENDWHNIWFATKL
jgi:hypothetical protein